MGKKDKKKKGLGKAKTEARVAKKADKARKKQLADTGDDDVEAILAAILAKEELQAAVTVVPECDPPSPRTAFTMVASPATDTDLLFFGGEHYTGERAEYFATTYSFNVEKKLWTRYDSATRPPPRSGHAVCLYKNFMFIFGGEFSNPSLSQYRHYRDLWRLDLEDFSWEKIEARGGPSARSGHRMCVVKGKLLVFGGYFDSGYGENRYYNDMYSIDLTAEEYTWSKVETNSFDLVPSPRSGFQWTVFGDEVWLYGGYCREVVQKAKILSHKNQKKGGSSAAEEAMVARGVVHSDMFKLNGDSLKWQKVKRNGYGPSRRSGFSVALHGRSFVTFGGVEDENETEEDMSSTFYNDIFGFNVDRKRWYPLTIRKRKAGGVGKRRRRKKREEEFPSTNKSNAAEVDAAISQSSAATREENEDETGGDEDEDAEIDTVALEETMKKEQEEEVSPCGRFNAVTAIIKNVLFIMGGVVEKKDADVTLDDLWSIDLKKLEEFSLVKPLSEKCAEWVESDDEEDDDEGGEDDEDMDDSSDEEEDGGDTTQRRNARRKRLQERITQEDDTLMPRVFESLKDYFDRSKNFWFAEVHESLGEGGKGARRIAFEWAFKKYWEMKPQLKELEDLEAELREEARLEEEFAKAKVDQMRGHNRR